jgi:hypothetical protein
MPFISRKKRSSKGRRSQNVNPEQGDVPKPRKYDYVTSSIPRIPANSQVYRTSTITETGAYLTQQAVSTTAASYTFSLSDIDNTANFVALFDQYRIAAVRIMFEPFQNAVQLTDPTITLPGVLYTVIDYDNTTTLANAAAARQYANCVEAAPGKSVCRSFVPHIAVAAYGGAFTQFANDEPHWIDSVSPTVQHYGVKALVSGGVAGQTLLSKWIVKRQYFLEFRNIY